MLKFHVQFRPQGVVQLFVRVGLFRGRQFPHAGQGPEDSINPGVTGRFRLPRPDRRGYLLVHVWNRTYAASVPAGWCQRRSGVVATSACGTASHQAAQAARQLLRSVSFPLTWSCPSATVAVAEPQVNP
jgi:hypothetical protein